MTLPAGLSPTGALAAPLHPPPRALALSLPLSMLPASVSDPAAVPASPQTAPTPLWQARGGCSPPASGHDGGLCHLQAVALTWLQRRSGEFHTSLTPRPPQTNWDYEQTQDDHICSRLRDNRPPQTATVPAAIITFTGRNEQVARSYLTFPFKEYSWKRQADLDSMQRRPVPSAWAERCAAPEQDCCRSALAPPREGPSVNHTSKPSG